MKNKNDRSEDSLKHPLKDTKFGGVLVLNFKRTCTGSIQRWLCYRLSFNLFLNWFSLYSHQNHSFHYVNTVFTLIFLHFFCFVWTIEKMSLFNRITFYPFFFWLKMHITMQGRMFHFQLIKIKIESSTCLQNLHKIIWGST